MHGTTKQTSMEQCIQNCQNCYAICEQTLLYCLQQGGPHVQASHIQTLLDCIQSCQVCPSFMLRNSPLHTKMCGLCAEACTRCAESCERLAGNDPQMKTCADMCRRCATSCQQMATRA
jgi:uncharacterized protein DUF326